MHVTFSIVCALVIGTFGAPDEIGGGFSFRSRSKSSLSGAAQVTAGNGKLSGDATGSAQAKLDSQIRGGAYLASKGKLIGVNGGLSGDVGGTAQGKVHGEVAQNKDGTISVGANSTLTSTSDAGVSGLANIATGDEELRQIAGYEGKSIERSSDGRGAIIDLGPLISAGSNIVENFWLYFWLAVGCIVFITCCCLLTVCGFYWKLVTDVKSLKIERKDVVNETAAPDEKHIVNISDWDVKFD